ncbi:MAG: NADH-quinone oxidoreductase subunit NuoE [Pseudomonadota bacterium]
MSARRLASEQPESFAFTAETLEKIEWWAKKYPNDKRQSTVIPALWLTQKQNDYWLSEPALRAVADLVGMPYIRVYEVATFYTMFNLEPVGRHHIQLCGTTPCMLRGAEKLKDVCEEKIGPKGSVSSDGKFSWVEVECLGACVNAPMVQINDYYYEDLDRDSFAKALDEFAAGQDPKPGNYVRRQTSAPEGDLTSLLDETLYDGSRAAPLTSIPGAPQPEPEAPAEAEPAPVAAAPQPDPEPEEEISTAEGEIEGEKPEALSAPRESGKDDLKRISGVGPKLEGVLNELGVYHFDQIAAWTRDNIEWVDGYLSFKGRIDREDWIAQAKALASEGEDA